MLAHGFDEAPEFQVYNEGNARAFCNFRLRPLTTIESLIERSWAEFVLFKLLCDSHRVPELLERFRGGRVIWAYRALSTAASAQPWRSSAARTCACCAPMLPAGTRMRGRCRDNPWSIDFIRSFDFGRLSAESAAALFWYVRNSLYFEMALDRREDTMLASYDQLLAKPERVAGALCAFLSLDYREALIAHIKPRRPAWKAPLAIDDRIRGRCAELQRRLDEVSLAHTSRLIGNRSIPRT